MDGCDGRKGHTEPVLPDGLSPLVTHGPCEWGHMLHHVTAVQAQEGKVS